MQHLNEIAGKRTHQQHHSTERGLKGWQSWQWKFSLWKECLGIGVEISQSVNYENDMRIDSSILIQPLFGGVLTAHHIHTLLREIRWNKHLISKFQPDSSLIISYHHFVVILRQYEVRCAIHLKVYFRLFPLLFITVQGSTSCCCSIYTNLLRESYTTVFVEHF
jgi:hypothetical protein